MQSLEHRLCNCWVAPKIKDHHLAFCGIYYAFLQYMMEFNELML